MCELQCHEDQTSCPEVEKSFIKEIENPSGTHAEVLSGSLEVS